jgi:nucleoside 2-deoxyribosyltransferase
LGYKCLRGDEQIATGDILARILKLICSARLVIANIDGRNPNVFFELGIALSMDKDVVIVANNNTNNPFDIMRENIVLWQNHSELRTKLKDMVLKALANQGMANKSLELSP